MRSLAPGLRLLNQCFPAWNNNCGRIYVFIFTFVIYACYHTSRKPISVVKSVLHENCTDAARRCNWKPFDGDNYNSLFGTLDLIYLSAYAVFMFLSGHVADRLHLRHYLTVGSLLSGLTTIAFGLGYFFNVHVFAFYAIVQFVGGAAQATGWPAVVACMGNWFGKSRRGFLMGVWNAHTSLGNILGSLVAGAFVDEAWGWSFVVPGLMIAGCGLLTFLFLAPYPEELGLPSPSSHGNTELVDPDGPAEDPEEDLVTTTTSSTVNLTSEHIQESHAASFLTALRVPGVIEYSLSLFFSKLVSYTFLFWLPDYIREKGGFNPSSAADLSAVFDLGGIVGGIVAGLFADRSAASASVCVVMLLCGVPSLIVYYIYGAQSIGSCIGWLIPLGLFVNGPYALITTAVAADLGTHHSLRSNAKALATVTGIIDGTGSVGAALGPLLCGMLKSRGWGSVFVLLVISLALSALLLFRRVRKEISLCLRTRLNQPMEAPVT